MGMAWPIIDGWVIPDDQYKLYEAKRYNDTPILVGYNSDEGASFSPPKTPEDYIAAVKARYGPFAESLLKAYPTDSTNGSEDRARPDARRGVRLAHLDLGAAAGEDRKIQSLLLLLRSAPGLSGRFAPCRLRRAARGGGALRVPASQHLESANYEAGPGDLGGHGHLLDELRQARRSQRPGPSHSGRPSATPIRW